jgi:hypothetical protein
MGIMPMATSILLVKIYTSDAVLNILLESPNSKIAATPWDQQDSFTSLTECVHTVQSESQRV